MGRAPFYSVSRSLHAIKGIKLYRILQNNAVAAGWQEGLALTQSFFFGYGPGLKGLVINYRRFDAGAPGRRARLCSPGTCTEADWR